MSAVTRFGISWRREEVNGQPGAVFFDREDRLIGVMSSTSRRAGSRT
jgi:hypothetical protein